jgi:acyl carrier protein
MKNEEKYRECFVKVFELSENVTPESLEYQSIPQWDSVGHMRLMTLLESGFDIMIDTEDIIDFVSYEKGKEILKKYDVDI